MRIFNRNIAIENNRYNVDGFKKETILTGFSINLKLLTTRDLKVMVLATFMPYRWLNKKFMQNKL